jgi:two-component system cell cycle sensor histidine kinase/response regulator CckA
MPNRLSRPGLSSALGRIESLRAEIAASDEPDRFAGELTDLRASLAELEVAYEELEQQNQELLTTREELELQRHRYRHLFDEAPFGYLVTDLSGVIEEANLAAAGMLGFPPWHLQGKPLSIFFSQEDRQRFRGLLQRIRASERLGEEEMTLVRREGAPFPAVLTIVRDLDDQQRAERLRWSIRDVSRTKAAEEALRTSEERLRHAQRMEAVGRLAGGIAHSFNNLLAAISFQCELLCDSLEEGDERRGNVEEIQTAGDRAAALARQLLAFGRKQVLQPRVLGVDPILRDMEPMLRRLLGENIRLTLRFEDQKGTVFADFGQLEQVILNLAVNARDAMPDGGELRLSTRLTQVAEAEQEAFDLPAGEYVELSVADTGTGMPPEVQERLFEPFFTTKARGEGTGLGLATVHGIVHQSGGHIRAESEPGAGTRFIILLPRSGDEGEAVQRRPIRPERRRRGSEVVLLVEDEDNIREPAVEILESRGYRVLSAADASQALALAERHDGPIHILVTDVVMPGRSGNWLAEQLTARRPEVRVLYMSGYPEDSITHHGVLSPTQNFLQKPFPPGQFLEKVREVLESAREPSKPRA